MKMYSLSKIQKIAILILIACIAITATLFETTVSPVKANKKIENLTDNSPIPLPENTNNKTLITDAVVSSPNASTLNQTTTPKKITTITDQKNTPWQLGDAKSAVPTIVLNKVISDYEIVEINQHPETLPQVGDVISLPMLHGKNIVVNVQTTKSNPNGDQSWAGHLEGYGDDYPIIMTYGEHSVFAMITTPEGSYSLESIDGSGWLYKNPSEIELSTTNSKDYLEPPTTN